MAEATEHVKKDRRTYHLMLFTDRRDGGVNQIGIDRHLIEALGIIILVALIVTITGWSVSSSGRHTLELQNSILHEDMDALEQEVSELTAANNELTSKVTILSDTVNTKVSEQNAIQEESDAAHMPEGFPLSSSASMQSGEDDPLTVILSSTSGTSVIATGAGVVTEVIPDAEYGYCIKIDHENGYVTVYYMASTPLIKEGDAVLQGAILSVVESDSSRLAYQVYLDGEQIDPMDIIKIDG